MNLILDRKKYAQTARRAAAESCVLLRNENQALPLRRGDKVAVFGRCADYYYKSGLGSGGLVNTEYVVGILDALKACDEITLDEALLKTYADWEAEHPINEGHGWGTVPWSQEEMPVTATMIESAKDADAAIVIIGRTAGEDQDNSNTEGSYLLTKAERDLLQKVCASFERSIVLLNVGNIIDMKWVEEYQPAAVMYVWQGGQEGGNGVVDVLTGKTSPSGKLTDTIAYDITDYPSTPYFGDEKKNYYKEDIYVGYRYFETFAKDKVLYPFGYGMSYTTFAVEAELSNITDSSVAVSGVVTNTGNCAGAEVVQVYVEAPQGRLGKPARVLAGFYKTEELLPWGKESFEIAIAKSYFASYDDSGVTGNRNCYVIEEGEYHLYAGTDVRSASRIGGWKEEKTIVIESLKEACAPVEEVTRMYPDERDGGYTVAWETVPVRENNVQRQIEQARDKTLAQTGDQGYQLKDVWAHKVTMDQFTAQLSDEDLICLFRGEGMCSPKVTPGTAGAFGGVTDELRHFGIPVACCADGPSGIRMDCGTEAFSLPNGTALGCTFNLPLVEELFHLLGYELRKNQIDTLLGPGINIHRNPLNGRNFEYISEDPFLTGKMGAVQLKGMHKAGVTGTIKHFCANNQEEHRTEVEAVISQRALREIYLKGFELSVKEGNAKSIMTTYGPLNGVWTAGNYELCTAILRDEWKYTGIVMTDWWAVANWEGEAGRKGNRAPMVIAQNDIYMCCADAKNDTPNDNLTECLESGVLKRSDLQRNAKNILKFLMESPCMRRELGYHEQISDENQNGEENNGNSQIFQMEDGQEQITIGGSELTCRNGKIQFELGTCFDGMYQITLEVQSDLSELAQLPVSVYMDNIFRCMLSFRGSDGKVVSQSGSLGKVIGKDHYIRLKIPAQGLLIKKIHLAKTE